MFAGSLACESWLQSKGTSVSLTSESSTLGKKRCIRALNESVKASPKMKAVMRQPRMDRPLTKP